MRLGGITLIGSVQRDQMDQFNESNCLMGSGEWDRSQLIPPFQAPPKQTVLILLLIERSRGRAATGTATVITRKHFLNLLNQI